MDKPDEIPPPTININTVLIDEVHYSYSISRLQNKDGISIKLRETIPNKNIFFSYEASKEEIAKDIKALLLCQNTEEMINALKALFEQQKIKVFQKDGQYFMQLEFTGIGISLKSEIKLEKHDPNDKLKDYTQQLKDMDLKYKELSKEISELKKEKLNENTIKDKIKEILQEKEIKDKLFDYFKEKIIEIQQKKEKDIDNKINDIINKELSSKVDKNIYETKIKNLETIIEGKLREIEKLKLDLTGKENNILNEESDINAPVIEQNKEFLNFVNQNDKNCILLKIKIDGNSKNNVITFFNYDQNFIKPDDIKIIIDNKKELNKYKKVKSPEESNKDMQDKRKRYIYSFYGDDNRYSFYYHFSNNDKDIHFIKIIFKQSLVDCSFMFYNCPNIIEIDCSYFDCSKVKSCSQMFSFCDGLKKIYFGKVGFSNCADFSSMFSNCINLIEFNSNFNTINAETFSEMFLNCKELKRINVKKFNLSNCKAINKMFCGCENLTEIDIFNWDMSNLRRVNGGIDKLFKKCRNLKK